MQTPAIDLLKYPVGPFISPASFSVAGKQACIETIRDFPAKMQEAAGELTAGELSYIYRPGGWSILQVIHHCADSHMNAFIRFKLALTEVAPVIKPYHEDHWAELPDTLLAAPEQSLMILTGVHARWTILLHAATSADFEKMYFHPEQNKLYRLGEVLALYDWHCRHHLAHIHQALKFKNNFKSFVSG